MTTPWNPPGTPYPPAQDGATLLVWESGPWVCVENEGAWAFELDLEDPPDPGCPWLLIPDPEQGEHSPGHDPDAAGRRPSLSHDPWSDPWSGPMGDSPFEWNAMFCADPDDDNDSTGGNK